ncbi:MAG TPA: LCP family protein [Candidatus Saccharimonadales bacterium]|nr:LCP family protein [Candidatus Saccharimonadales bacterium]
MTKAVSPRFIDGIGPARPVVGQKPLPVLRPMTEVVQPQPAPEPEPLLQLAARPPIDMDLPGEASPSTLHRADPAKWRRVKHGLRRGMAVAVVLILLAGGSLAAQGYLKLHKVFKGGTASAAALQANVNPDLLKGEGSGRVNILLLGRGGGNHDGPDLTDSMMLASVDPVNHTSTLISIPRDLWVNVPNGGDMKINAAWETGEFKYEGKIAPGSTNSKAIQAGFDSVDQTVQSVLGVTVNYNLLVDFQAFQQAVDTVGGVTINVPTDLVDPTMAWENGNNPVLAKAGIQQFNGKQALTYVRSRETTSDFARAERQRSVLVALKGKVTTLGTLSNPLKISGLMNAFGNNVATDLSLKDAARLYDITKGIDNSKVVSTSLDDSTNPLVSTGNLSGQSIVLPKSGLFNYSDIQQYVRGQLKDPYILKENARILVLNGSTTPGLATTLSNQLKSYGYNVVGVGNTPNSDWTSTTLVDLTHNNKYTKNYLEQRFGQKALTQLADKSIATNGADFVIIIGSDEANLTQP